MLPKQPHGQNKRERRSVLGQKAHLLAPGSLSKQFPLARGRKHEVQQAHSGDGELTKVNSKGLRWLSPGHLSNYPP